MKDNKSNKKNYENYSLIGILPLGQDLLTPTEIYVKAVLPAMRSRKVKGLAHITGGGLVENIPRVLPPGVDVALDANKWKVPQVFGWLQHMVRDQDTANAAVKLDWLT